jgi:hypothetical protein
MFGADLMERTDYRTLEQGKSTLNTLLSVIHAGG